MASSDLINHKYLAEVTLGTTPAAALTKMTVVSSSIDANISTTVSNQINPNRYESDLIQTEASTAGDIGIEWQYGAYDPFIESALGGTFSTLFSLTATDISAASADQSFNSVAAAFNTATVLPGHWIYVTGFTGSPTTNNGLFKVVSCTTAKIIVEGTRLVNDAAGESVTIKSRSCRNASTRKSFTIEKEFTDTSPVMFAIHRGMVVNTMNVNSATGSVVNGSFGFSGLTTDYKTATSGTGADIAATTNEVFSPVSGVGTIYEGGTVLTGACVKSINLTTTNNLRPTACLGSLYPTNLNLGTLSVTGTIELYLANKTLLDKFVGGTYTSLSYSFDDVDGNQFVIYLPRVRYSSASISGISKGSDAMVSLGFTSIDSDTDGFGIQISCIPA